MSTLPNVRSPIDLLASMATEESGKGKLAQFMSNHVLCYEHGNVLSSVMHHEGVTDEGVTDEWYPAECSLHSKRQHHIPRHPAPLPIAGAHEQHAAGDDGASRIHCAAFCGHSVHGGEFAGGVEVPNNFAVFC